MSAVKLLSDDLAELSLDRVDKEISTQLKSDEELDRLTVDPHLTGIERAVYLLSTDMKSFLANVAHHHARRLTEKARESNLGCDGEHLDNWDNSDN